MFIEHHYGAYIIHNHRADWNGCQSPNCPRSDLVQTDWDYPSTAESLGWSLRKVQRNRRKPCDHRSTDGTVNCPECGITASEFITAAANYLDSKC